MLFHQVRSGLAVLRSSNRIQLGDGISDLRCSDGADVRTLSVLSPFCACKLTTHPTPTKPRRYNRFSTKLSGFKSAPSRKLKSAEPLILTFSPREKGHLLPLGADWGEGNPTFEITCRGFRRTLRSSVPKYRHG